MGRSFARPQKNQHKYIVSKICLGWKLSPIINMPGGGGVGIRMSWVEKNRKINQRGGTSNGHTRVYFVQAFYEKHF